MVFGLMELSAGWSATRWSKGSLGFRVDREVMTNLVTQLFMRVQAPPSRCRSDSVSPRLATGSQGLKRGSTAEPGSLNPGIPSRRH